MTQSPERLRCTALVASRGLSMIAHRHRCLNFAVGKSKFCRLHDPVFQERKRRARDLKFDAQMAANKLRWQTDQWNEKCAKLVVELVESLSPTATEEIRARAKVLVKKRPKGKFKKRVIG